MQTVEAWSVNPPGASVIRASKAISYQLDLLNDYVSHLGKVRPDIAKSNMDGRTFIGKRAIESKMLDAITKKDEALADLRTFAKIN